MLRIIDGKRYNTKTAEEIDSYWNGLSTSDFRRIDETLYVTKKRQLFFSRGGRPND